MARGSFGVSRVSLVFDDDTSMSMSMSMSMSVNSSRNTSMTEDSSVLGFPAAKRKRMSTPLPTKRRLAGHLYSWGENSIGGQLGHGSAVSERCKPKLINGLASHQIIDMVAGGMHNACVTQDGSVYTFGCNDDKQLGRGGEKAETKQIGNGDGDDSEDDEDEEEKMVVPGVVAPEIFSKHHATNVVAGDRYTAVLTAEGQIYAWGTFMMEIGGGRPLGVVPDTNAPKQQPTPVLIEGIDETIVKLTGGDQHIAMLSNKGHIWTIGVGFVGQLGRIHENNFDESRLQEDEEHFQKLRVDQLTPRKVTPRHTFGKGGHNRRPGYFVDVWSGGYCTVALAHKDCDVYGWGLNVSNQLGLEDGNDRYRPKKLDAISNGIRWQKMAFGLRHSLMLTNLGHVWAVGEEHYGRLGLGKDCGPQSCPKEIEGVDDVVDVSCGPYTSAAVTRSGQLFTWGKKGIELGQCSRDQLDDDDVGDFWTPTAVVSQQLQDKRVLAVALGGQHCLALATELPHVNGA